MNGHSTFVRTIERCLSIEEKAVKGYKVLSDRSENESARLFFKDMADQERQHVAYWSRVLELANAGRIQNVFDRPDRIIDDLVAAEQAVDRLLADVPERTGAKNAFLTAYRLEFYVLHPAFAALFHLQRSETGDASPADLYEGHIHGLISEMKRCCPVDPEIRLIADLMERLWAAHRELAVQLAEIRSLRHLVPICMHCKNVRNDRGFWGKVETYVEAHSHMEFSHGICPDCMRKLHPQFDFKTS